MIRVVNVRFYLCNHHVAVKGASAMVLGGLVNVGADLCNDGRSEGDVRHEMAIPTLAHELIDILYPPLLETTLELTLERTFSNAGRELLHDINMEPVGALVHCAGAFCAELGKVGRQNRGCNNGVGRHLGRARIEVVSQTSWRVRWRPCLE